MIKQLILNLHIHTSKLSKGDAQEAFLLVQLRRKTVPLRVFQFNTTIKMFIYMQPKIHFYNE